MGGKKEGERSGGVAGGSMVGVVGDGRRGGVGRVVGLGLERVGVGGRWGAWGGGGWSRVGEGGGGGVRCVGFCHALHGHALFERKTKTVSGRG